jgi:hypothetical protein
MRTPCMEISPSASSLMRMVGPFSERARDGRAMIEYFHTGQYIADTASAYAATPVRVPGSLAPASLQFSK